MSRGGGAGGGEGGGEGAVVRKGDEGGGWLDGGRERVIMEGG